MIRRPVSLRRVLSIGTAAVLCIGVGCKQDSKKSDETAETPPSPKATEPTTTPVSASATTTIQPAVPESEEPQDPDVAISKGIAEAGNNPKLVELVSAFESCKLTSKRPGWDCREAIKPFHEAVDKVADLPTLFNFLDDTQPHVRLAALSAIAGKMIMQGKEGREFGARLTAAAAREVEPVMAQFFGDSVLQGDFESDRYSAAEQAIVATHPVEQIRAAVVSNLPVQGWETFFPFLKDRLEKEKSPMVREAIMASFYTSAGKDGACDFFAANLGDDDAKVAAKAAYNIVWTRDACAETYDNFLAHFEGRVAAGKADFMYLNATNYFSQDEKATDEQKVKYFGLLKKVVEDTNIAGMGRASALKNIGKYATDGKAFAKKFTGDTERFVADAAKEIVKGK